MNVQNTKEIVYTPDSLLGRPDKLIKDMYSDLMAGRELSWRLAIRDISSQYRQTLLGFLWIIIIPLANTFIWLFLNKSGAVTISKTSIPYPIYVFTGTMLWGILIDAVNAPLQSTMASKMMLAKINFPRESLIVSGIYKTVFNSLIKIVILITGLLLLGVKPGYLNFYIPFGIISIILVGTTIGLLLTPIGMLYGDIGKAIPLLMQFMMYLSPVVFPMPDRGLSAKIIGMNPFTPIIETTRGFITSGSLEMINYFIIVNILSFILLMAVWVVFRLAMPILIERMSA